MIQLKRNNKSKEGFFNIFIGEDLLSNSWAFKPVLEPNYPFQYSAKGWACWRLASQTLEDFEPFTVISLNNLFSWMIKGHSIIFSLEKDDETQQENVELTFYFSPNLAFWNEQYSFTEYFNEFEKVCEHAIEGNYNLTFEDIPSLRLEIRLNKFSFPIERILYSIEERLSDIHEKSTENLLKNLQVDFVKTVYNFPKELKVSCEQYLLYFAQFLQDLGINATSNLQEEAGKVLFSVTPIDDFEALDKIREALAVYLNLPSSPIVYDESFAALRLKQQIDSLKHSQQMAESEFRLKMAQSLLEAQNKTIEDQGEIIVHQATFIQQQKEHIEKIKNPSVMIDSAQNKEELEEICDGLKIGKSKFLKEQLGIDFNPATFAKGIGKKILGKPENNSILETSDETGEKD